MTSPTTTSATPTPTGSATTPATSPAAGSLTEAGLAAVLGPDYVPQVTDGEGSFVVRPGSDTASTVPAGWTATGQVMLYRPGDTTLASLCAPLSEKGYTFEACRPVTGPGGVVLQRRAQSGGGTGGTSSQVRYLHDLGDGDVRVTDLVLDHPGTVAPSELAAADAWIAAHEDVALRLTAYGEPA